jgi:hypothetical protein
VIPVSVGKRDRKLKTPHHKRKTVIVHDSHRLLVVVDALCLLQHQTLVVKLAISVITASLQQGSGRQATSLERSITLGF